MWPEPLPDTPAYEQSRRHAQEGRDAVRPPQAHPQARPASTAGPCGARDEFLLAATAQNLRKLAKLRPDPPPTLQPA